MVKKNAKEHRRDPATEQTEQKGATGAGGKDRSDPEESTGSNPTRFVLIFFGIPLLLILVISIVSTPCNS